MKSSIHLIDTDAITLDLFALKLIIFNSSRHAKRNNLNGTDI